MEGSAFSLLLVIACFAGVALIARANHQATIDPLTGRPAKYWQPWRAWSMGIVAGLGVLYALSVVILIAVDPGR